MTAIEEEFLEPCVYCQFRLGGRPYTVSLSPKYPPICETCVQSDMIRFHSERALQVDRPEGRKLIRKYRHYARSRDED